MTQKSYFCFKITGVVQGVGFRPFIYREAVNRGLIGYVKNTGQGVEIVCDDKEQMKAILEELPPLASVSAIKVSTIHLTSPSPSWEEGKFQILFSEDSSEAKTAKIPADTAICEDCITELLDKNNRRHNYFFISCTNCGPRYSLAEGLPFDRETTSLKSFKLCGECQHDYTDPSNRRFHAQTTACVDCGPQITLYKNGEKVEEDPLKKTIELIQQGEIVSVKGIGGFSLFSLADKKTTETLRTLLNRPIKPFAVMAKDLEMAKKLVHISETEAEILQSKERPIVLCKKVATPSNSPYPGGEVHSISPNNRIGIMLPYTGIHHLLFESIKEPLIVSSANLPGIPIPTKREEQNWEYILDYNRVITNFSDDSIVKCIGKTPLIIRRSRGYAPNEIMIPKKYQTTSSDLLAVGAEMKNTFCLKNDKALMLSPHIGNTAILENLANFEKVLKQSKNFAPIEPQQVLHDKNHQFNTTNLANTLNITTAGVPHHGAHAFSVAMEHNLDDFIAIVADGTGLGDDGKVWGGEVFHNDKRIGHLEYQPLIGGDSANKNPVKILTGILSKFMTTDEVLEFLNKINPTFKKSDINIYLQQKEQGINTIETSSCGRILDAAAILLEFGTKNHYEGYLAEMLESNSYPCTQAPLAPPVPQGILSCAGLTIHLKEGEDLPLFFEPVIEEENGLLVLKTTELFAFLVKNLEKISHQKLATFVQLYLAKGFWEIAQRKNKILPVVFSGGCAYNDIMTSFLSEKGVRLNKEIPSGDGGISAGQISYRLWSTRTKKRAPD